MKPLHYYLLGTGSWFLSYGIQAVTFAWLVTIVLHESATMVGFAQLAFMIPAMLLMLIGGSLADHFGGRKIAIYGHILAACAPLFLSIVIVLGHLDYSMVIIFAVIMGIAQALITPARDGLLSLVADGQIQRKVVLVSMVQFGIQMLGFLIASFADDLGALFVLSMQFIFLSAGTLAYYRLNINFEPPKNDQAQSIIKQVYQSIYEGYETVKQSPIMRAVVIQNVAMGIFFMGSYTVSLPLLVREVYQGSAAELSWVNTANSLGLLTTILFLMRFGDIKHQGRALLISQTLGCIALAAATLGLGFYSLITAIYCWGMCGGIGMTMSRTIMQEIAPQNQRSRMMAFYAFSFMGAGPIGALYSGYLSEWLGPPLAIFISSGLMMLVVIIIGIRSVLWRLTTKHIVQA